MNLLLVLIKQLEINELNLFYNQALIKLNGFIKENIFTSLYINNFHLGNFLYPYLQGILNGNVNIQSNYDFSYIQLSGNISLNRTIYTVDNYFSREQNLYLKTDGTIIRNNSTNIYLNVYELSAKTINDQIPFIVIKGKTWLTFGNSQNYNIDLTQLKINYKTLEEKLPVNLKATLISVKQILEKGIELNGKANLTFSNNNVYKTDLNLLLPSLHPSPINIDVDIEQGKTAINFNKVSILGWYNSLIVKLKGNMNKVKEKWIPDIKLFLQYQNPQLSEVYNNIFLRGRMLLEANYKINTIKGKIDINHFDLKYILECEKENKELCPYYQVEGLNLSLPFLHTMEKKTFISYQGFEDIHLPEPNIKIKSIKSNYSLDNSYYQNGFYFLGSNDHNAIEGYLQYKENILWIPYLKFYSFLKNRPNGNIELKNFYFNLSDLKPENMNIAGKFYIINYDLNALFPKAESVFKGDVSGYIFFRSNSFDDIIRNINVKSSIYKISKDFAGFAVRIIAPTIIAAVVNETLRIEGIDLELNHGVVYTYIKVKSPGFFSLSRIIQPMDEEIRQERIPLAEFIKRSQKEIKMELE
ncbi:MAG: hypothetical protein KatS3mg129_2106 [Leptospiraceae bacterium]|nr:MAG: hypothetical protein KatS3mg129_2106 [Leptospiraceae bacterium]